MFIFSRKRGRERKLQYLCVNVAVFDGARRKMHVKCEQMLVYICDREDLE